ncbi:putative amastin [Trypanosoma cruzi]|nr:putative amastin [Trypanosoma cruzi]
MGFETLAGRVGPFAYMVCACISFVFATVSTPTSQFKGKGYLDGGKVSKLSCVTAWGVKNECTSDKYDLRSSEINCDGNDKSLHQLFQTTQAFSIISIFLTFASIITVGMLFNGKSTKRLTIILAVASVAVLLIPWACMAAVYKGSFCGTAFHDNWRRDWKYSSAFGLFLGGWLIQVVGTFLLLVL